MITLRPYQERAVSVLQSTQRGIVHAPAGSGKTIIGAAALDRWLAQFDGWSCDVRWFGNTLEQCMQARTVLAQFPGIAQRAKLSISCYASSDSALGADLVICDECHHVAAPTIRRHIEKHTGSLWGLSATPNRADKLAGDVFDLIGPVVCKIDRAELVQAGELARARVQFHSPNSPHDIRDEVQALAEPLIRVRLRTWRGVSESDVRKRTLWQLCLKLGIFDNKARDAAIVRLGREHSQDFSLVLVGSIEHGEKLSAEIPGSVVVHSKIGARRRREALERFSQGDLHCLIATSLADEGLDLPRANVLILAAGGRSSAKAEQRTGRVLRSFSGKEEGIIHDFWDHQHYFLLAQSKARRRLYESLGYSVSGVPE